MVGFAADASARSVPLDNSAPGRHTFAVNPSNPQNAEPFDSSVASFTSPVPMDCQQDLEQASPPVPLTEVDDAPAKSSDVEAGALEPPKELDEAAGRSTLLPEKPPYMKPGKLSDQFRASAAKGEQKVVNALDYKISLVRKKTALYGTLLRSTRVQYRRMLKYLEHLNKLRRLRNLPQIVLSTTAVTKADVFSVATE